MPLCFSQACKSLFIFLPSVYSQDIIVMPCDDWAEASLDDGSCLFAPCNNGCDGDIVGDSSVTVNDILLLLSNFGTICQ